MEPNLKLALMVFNLTVGIYLLARFFLGGPMYFNAFIVQALIGAAIGLVTGGIAYVLTPKQ